MSAGLNSEGIVDPIVAQEYFSEEYLIQNWPRVLVRTDLASQSTRTGCGVDGGRDSSTVRNHSLKI